MASGLPLVAPNTGGITSYANSENAWTVNCDVDSFAEAIREVTNHPALTAKKVENALITAQQYQWDRVAASFLGLYKELNRGRRETGQAKLPAFYSTPPGSLRAGVLQGAANLAVSGFRFWSGLASTKTRKLEAAARSGTVLEPRDRGGNERLPA